MYMRENDPERIICAAIWFDTGEKVAHQPENIDNGIVICGLRHHNCFKIATFVLGKNKSKYNPVQGFLTSKNRFVDRIEAYKIAVREKQILEIYSHMDKDSAVLFSEDLY